MCPAGDDGVFYLRRLCQASRTPSPLHLFQRTLLRAPLWKRFRYGLKISPHGGRDFQTRAVRLFFWVVKGQFFCYTKSRCKVNCGKRACATFPLCKATENSSKACRVKTLPTHSHSMKTRFNMCVSPCLVCNLSCGETEKTQL